MEPICTPSQPSSTEENSDKDIKISFVCTLEISEPVTTMTVHATIGMSENRVMNMSGIDDFDSVVTDRNVDNIKKIIRIFTRILDLLKSEIRKILINLFMME